ncbi:MAG: tetratricopeptide repeat protein [Planctomycetes bacterium]|nr:tetratricopeptide repeat protein [Planctomycetota bacterium]
MQQTEDHCSRARRGGAHSSTQVSSQRTGIELLGRPVPAMLVAVVLLASHVTSLAQEQPSAKPQVSAQIGDSQREVEPDEGEEKKVDPLASKGPLPPPGFMGDCVKLIRANQTGRARRRLEPVVADHPGWAKAHFYLGLTYHTEKRYERAVEWFKRSLELDPLDHTPRVFLGWGLYYLGEPEASRAMFESYLEIKPDYPDAIFALGLIDFDADDIPSAKARFEKVIRLARAQKSSKTEAKARARLADVLIRLNELEPARKELDKSIELNPDNYEAYYKLSRVLERLGDHEAAEKARSEHDAVRDRVTKAKQGVHKRRGQ